MTDLDFGSFLRVWRRARGQTQAQVAASIGRSSWYICGIENGFVEPDAEDVRRLQQALALPPFETE